MKGNNLYKLLIISILCLFGVSGFSQDDCTLILAKAQRLFDAGNIEQIPAMLKPCMDKGFTTEEKQQAQKLIVLSYLFDKNTSEAEKAMFEFLKKYPEYTLSTSDQAEFVQLFDTYRTLPIASLGVSGGVNYSTIQVIRYYGAGGGAGSYTAPSMGFQGGLSFRLYLTDKFDANIEANFMQSKFQYFNDKMPAGNTLTYTETQNYAAIPISAIYTPVVFNKISPFVRLGISVNYMLSSAANGILKNETAVKEKTGSDFSMLESRNPLQFQVQSGIGLTYKMKQSYILFDVRYSLGLQQLTKGGKGIDAPNPDLYSYYQYVEDDFKMSNLSVSIGLFYKFYKPKKRN